MKRCRRANLEITRRCNLKCKMCFYRHEANFNEDSERPPEEITNIVRFAKNRKCEHVTVTGWGEPFLFSDINGLIKYVRECVLTMSIISNGCIAHDRYQKAFDLGLDHLHLSAHGIGDVFDEIVGVKNAHKMNHATLEWLRDTRKTFRTNTTLQRANMKQLPEIAKRNVEMGSMHQVLLGFLPHYHWNDNPEIRKVAAHPLELKPYVEQAADSVLAAGRLLTIRYTPFCCIDRKYWPYIVNARYVMYDPFEWDYERMTESDSMLWQTALYIGEMTAIKGEPCSSCNMRMHCGGWNKFYHNAFPDFPIKPIREDINQTIGFYHDQNPANQHQGWFHD